MPGWVVTYGDMMSLLLTFFILLVSFSSIQETKFKEAMESLQGALGVLQKYTTAIDFRTLPVYEERQTDNSEIYYQIKKLEQFLLDEGIDQAVEIEVTADGIRLRVVDSFLFPSARADLQPQAMKLLDSIAGMLDGMGTDITISGHTDSVPIHTARFPSNWELSAARAIAVARRFQEVGVNPQRMSAVGYGEFRPLDNNATTEGRAANRRVEIFLKMEEAEDTPTQGLPLESAGEDNG
ncbi:flagellar motor protein MotB [bacterium]|nr:flagellar motor protein MotB [bacterium]MBU1072833.1 flagellar motor protein MotB [bacterium]MBU1674553.1 flagellar motor protein MotB [bacterium]